MSKTNNLLSLRKEIERCDLCRSTGSGEIVFGEGNPNTKVIFVGEAPGKQEALTGRPFIGRSGQLLRKTIRSIGLSEKDIYITSPVKYLPVRGTPSKKEIVHSKTHFEKQIEIINPSIVVLLGKTAIHALLNEDVPVLKDHGTIVKKLNQTFFITLHPAAVIRFPKYTKIFLEDFKKIKKLLKK